MSLLPCISSVQIGAPSSRKIRVSGPSRRIFRLSAYCPQLPRFDKLIGLQLTCME